MAGGYINPRLAAGIGRPDKAMSFSNMQVGGAGRIRTSGQVAHGGGVGRGAGNANGTFSTTTNLSLGVSGVLVIVLVIAYIYIDKKSGRG